jgi:hypothetical protein
VAGGADVLDGSARAPPWRNHCDGRINGSWRLEGKRTHVAFVLETPCFLARVAAYDDGTLTHRGSTGSGTRTLAWIFDPRNDGNDLSNVRDSNTGLAVRDAAPKKSPSSLGLPRVMLREPGAMGKARDRSRPPTNCRAAIHRD